MDVATVRNHRKGELHRMKTRHGQIALLFTLLGCASAFAASVPGTLSTDYQGTADWLKHVVVGIDGEQIGRTIEPDNAPDAALKVYAYSVFVGYDIRPDITIFGTIGGTDDQSDEDSSEDSSGSSLKASVGANFNLARYNIRQPDILVGDHLTIRLQPELAMYNADLSDWFTASVALPITYENIEGETYFSMTPDDRFAFAFYAGPLFSYMRGETDLGGLDGADFEGKKLFGLLAGLDLYFTSYVSIGGHIEFFDADDDNVTGGADFRYHF